MSYFKYIKRCNIISSDSLWTVEVFQLPYNIRETLQKFSNPVKRISVLLAVNASGDHITPFMVYPRAFDSDDTVDFQNETDDNHNFSIDGSITCRIFQIWINKLFLPHLRKKKSNIDRILLLFCGKLSVIDTRSFEFFSRLNEPRINLFAFTSKKQMPFKTLYQETERNCLSFRSNLLFKNSFEYRNKNEIIKSFDSCRLWPINIEMQKKIQN